ncbi:MAG TPA: hypothetical protein VJ925_05255 [Longimicrobiales bacterium]|nr:hypothetical protein [Longimicrobiales bacterium]
MPRRRVILGHTVVAVLAFVAAFALLLETGSEFALVLLLPAMLFLVRALVGIRRRRERDTPVRDEPSHEGSDTDHQA